jgi:glycosyltransferase involved in cell wall biosynthesis
MKITLLCLAPYAQYPHISRHLGVIQTKSTQASFACISPPPSTPETRAYSLGTHMPRGPFDFVKAAWKAWSILEHEQPDLVEAIDPPMQIPAALWCRLRKKQLVYFSMELWSELPSLRNRPVRRWIWAFLEKWSLPTNPKIATVSPGVAKLLSAHLRFPVEVIRNLPPQQTTFNTESPKPIKPYRLAYHGLVESGRGLEILIKAINLLPQTSDWELIIIGGGPLLSSLQAKASARVRFTGWLPYEKSIEVLQTAHVGALLIEDRGLSFRHSLPGKLYEYVQQNLPVLAAPLPDMQHEIQTLQLGVVCQNWSIQAVHEGLHTLELKYQAILHSQRKAQAQLTWNTESLKLLSLLQ